MPNEIEPPFDQVFENPDSKTGLAAFLFLGGIGLIVLAVAGFLVAINTRHGQMSLHLTTTLPVILAVGMLARGFSLRTIPSRIVVGHDAIEITTRQTTRRYTWPEIGSAATANVLNSHKSFLRITDPAGGTIVRVDESFPEFPRLVEQVQSHIDAKTDDTAVRIMSRKARRTALLSFAMGCFLGFAAVFIAFKTHEEKRANELLDLKGVPGEGEIVRRFVAPNGVTRRLEYRVAGSGVENVEVYPALWDRLEHAKTIPVLYVPDEPDVNRLTFGEVKDDDLMSSPKGGYLLSALGGLMALFLLAFSPFAWMGYDLTFDNERHTWKIKRYGRVIWASKQEALRI